MFTKMTRERPAASARCQCRMVCTSIPITALTVKRAPSTTRSAAMASPWKPASPGVSIRLIFRPCHSTLQIDAERDIWRRCSSSSQSLTVEPDSTVPSRLVAPAWNRSASTSDVLPVPRCPTTATLRIFPGSSGIQQLLCAMRFERRIVSRSVLAGGSGGGAREAGLEAQDGLGVELGDPGLGDAQHLADLAQGELLVVVKGYDELLSLRQPCDGLADRLLHLGLRERALRIRRIDVLDRVDQRDRIAAAGVHAPELVQGTDRRARDVGEGLLQLVGRDAELVRDLVVGGRAVELALELGDGPLDVARAGTHGPWHPIHRPELVDDRALDPCDRVRLELDVAVRVVALDRPDQAQQSVGHEIAL